MSANIHPAAHEALEQVPASAAKNGFSELIERVSRRDTPVLITRNARPTAVMLSVEQFDRLTQAVPDPLASLTAEFDATVARMQTPAAKAAVDALFAAKPDELGQAAARGAQGGRKRR